MLPSGVHAIKRRSNKVAYYWRPGRGTKKAGKSVRLPDDPTSSEFWAELERLRSPAKTIGTLPVMIDAYQASPHYMALASATRREYDRYMAVLKATFSTLDASAIEPRHIAGFRDELGDTPAKANAYVRAIAALYVWGRERGFASSNPADGIKKLKVGEYDPWPQWAWDIAQKHFRAELRIACSLALYTGQRLGDVLNMKLGDIRENVVTVRQAKTGKTLQIPLHSELRPLVAECRERGAIYLVSRAKGEPFTVDQFHAAWTREMEKEPHGRIRRENVVFHGLRKSAAVKLAMAGCTAKEIAAVTGQSLVMVEHYTKAADQLTLATSAMKRIEGSGL